MSTMQYEELCFTVFIYCILYLILYIIGCHDQRRSDTLTDGTYINKLIAKPALSCRQDLGGGSDDFWRFRRGERKCDSQRFDPIGSSESISQVVRLRIVTWKPPNSADEPAEMTVLVEADLCCHRRLPCGACFVLWRRWSGVIQIDRMMRYSLIMAFFTNGSRSCRTRGWTLLN